MRKRAVLVTGALGGIGRALCNEFHAHGFVVIAVDRVEGRVAAHHIITEDICHLVSHAGHRSAFYDKTKSILSQEGADLCGLVNNAAVQILGGVEALSKESWRETLETNLLAPFFLSQLFLPELEAARAAIVNISSIHEKLTKPGFVAYATSKSALSGLTRAMAVDLGPRVRVNAVCPAAIHTAMLESGFAGRPQEFAALHQSHPSGRIGMPEEVANLVRYLVADAPHFLTGSCLGLDGAIAGRLNDPL